MKKNNKTKAVQNTVVFKKLSVFRNPRPFWTKKIGVAAPRTAKLRLRYLALTKKSTNRLKKSSTVWGKKIRSFNNLNSKRVLGYIRTGNFKKRAQSSGVELLRQIYLASSFWSLRLMAYGTVKRFNKITFRAAQHKFFANTPHNTFKEPYFHYTTKKTYRDVGKINRRHLWVLFRMRFERFMFKALGCRVYVWFSNLWKTVSSDIAGWFIYENFVIIRLIKKGMRFTIREAHARVLIKSAWLAVTMLGGVSVFMQMMCRMVQSFRSHWAVVMYTLRVLDSCRCYFWYKTLMQYRMVVRGKFGGYMRANQKVFQQGVVKLNAWALDIDYYRIRPVTKYGTFSLRFWVQFRDLRTVRVQRLAAEKGADPRSLRSDSIKHEYSRED